MDAYREHEGRRRRMAARRALLDMAGAIDRMIPMGHSRPLDEYPDRLPEGAADMVDELIADRVPSRHAAV